MLANKTRQRVQRVGWDLNLTEKLIEPQFKKSFVYEKSELSKRGLLHQSLICILKIKGLTITDQAYFKICRSIKINDGI